MTTNSTPCKTAFSAVLALLLLASPALAQDGPPGTDAAPQTPPSITGAGEIMLNGNYKIRDMVEYFARVLGDNYILEGGDRSLNEEVSIISHRPRPGSSRPSDASISGNFGNSSGDCPAIL